MKEDGYSYLPQEEIELQLISPEENSSRDYENLIPTPSARDHKDGADAGKIGERDRKGSISRLIFSDEVNLFYTPQSVDGTKGSYLTETEQINKNKSVNLHNQINEIGVGWGRYQEAIDRWEKVMGRPAPAPTKPDGKDGAHRLSSLFVEWLMGLPEGWVTDCGLSRLQELKACGNGVVPQQAELALRILLEEGETNE